MKIRIFNNLLLILILLPYIILVLIYMDFIDLNFIIDSKIKPSLINDNIDSPKPLNNNNNNNLLIIIGISLIVLTITLTYQYYGFEVMKQDIIDNLVSPQLIINETLDNMIHNHSQRIDIVSELISKQH